jgi:hypothetical protein
VVKDVEEQTELLREMRDLLRVIAEPALADRDKRVRKAIREVVGRSKQKAGAVLLMNGKRSQSELRNAAGMDSGNLSRLVAALRDRALIKPDERQPELVISVPPNFFDDSEVRNE